METIDDAIELWPHYDNSQHKQYTMPATSCNQSDSLRTDNVQCPRHMVSIQGYSKAYTVNCESYICRNVVGAVIRNNCKIFPTRNVTRIAICLNF